jgi:bifunctional ADP-heptose synthase (sugar kinase/adenylyltransferase)
VLSIANICSEWVAKVTVVTNGKERDLSAFSSSKQNIELRLLESDRPTIKKHRFIDLASHHKVFEYYDFDSTDLGNSEIQEFLLLLSDIDSFDLVIVADFGHGVLVDKIRDLIVNKSRYLCVNTQANAGNRGFNTISKYKRADLFALNSGELQLELRNRNPNYKNVVPKIMKTMGSHRCILTLGGSGLLVFDEHGYIHAPALALRVVDKVGAGDAVFACASLLSSASMPSSLIGLVCNMIAAHEVNQLGHHSALNPAILLDQVNRVFGQVRERIERPL